MSTQFVSQGTVNLDVRPKRAAYLIRSSSASQFRRAVQHASSRWGGIQELIIPVSRGGRVAALWAQLVEIMQPDIIFDTSDLSPAGRAKVSEVLGQEPQDVAHELRVESGAHPLIVYPRNRLAGLTIQGPASDAICDIAAVGSFSDWNPFEQWSDASVAQPETTPLGSAIAQLDHSTVMAATAFACSEVAMSGVGSGRGLLWIADSRSFKDALWFWNTRALMPVGLDVAPVALVHPEVTKLSGFRKALHKALLSKSAVTTPDVLINSLTLSRQKLTAVRIVLGLDRFSGRSFSRRIIGERDPTSALTAAVNVDALKFLVGSRTPGVRAVALTTLTSPTTTVRVGSPVAFATPAGGRIRIGLSGPSELEAPQSPTTAALYHKHAVWKQGRLELETSPHHTYQFDLRIPDGSQILQAALRGRGARYELSPPGRLAQGLVERLDDHGLALFRDPLASRVVQALTTPRSRALAKALADELPGTTGTDGIAEIAERLGGQLRQTHRTADAVASMAELSQATAGRILAGLFNTGLVEYGFRHECNNCGLETFCQLQAAGPRPACPGCHAPGSFTLDEAGVQPALTYRLNSLLDRASDQGVLAHLYAGSALMAQYPGLYMLMGANIFDDDTHVGEVDVLGVAGSDIVSGEAKMSPAAYSAEQVKRDVAMSERLGATIHVMACVRPISRRAGEEAQRECQARNMTLVVLAPSGGSAASPPPDMFG